MKMQGIMNGAKDLVAILFRRAAITGFRHASKSKFLIVGL